MNPPNLFNFATSELSQDATLAYILAWAKPEYKDSGYLLNRLGESLLRAMVENWARATDNPDPLKDVPISSLVVGTQYEQIDVWAEINDDLVLIIEDKTQTVEHSDQIARYLQKAEKIWPKRRAVAVYTKTGNECLPAPEEDKKHFGMFLRPDLLNVLDSVIETDNTILAEFKQYLQTWQDETDSYQTEPYHRWKTREDRDWRATHAIEGFYNELNRWLACRDEWSKWGYVANPNGGFMGFWWHWKVHQELNCKLYLQIESGWRLQIRITRIHEDNSKSEKVHKDLMWEAWYAIEAAASAPEFERIQIKKSGRYRGGKGASVADVTFYEKDTYLASKSDGIIHMPGTKRNMQLAMQLVDAVCAVSDEVQA